MMPIVDELEEEFAGEVEVVRLNAGKEDEARMAATIGLRGHPSFAILTADGQVSDRFFGPQPAELLRSAMASLFQEGG
jgi:thioredoxin-like negative regulator of GroEL